MNYENLLKRKKPLPVFHVPSLALHVKVCIRRTDEAKITRHSHVQLQFVSTFSFFLFKKYIRNFLTPYIQQNREAVKKKNGKMYLTLPK
jgi:hypothetical protein